MDELKISRNEVPDEIWSARVAGVSNAHFELANGDFLVVSARGPSVKNVIRDLAALDAAEVTAILLDEPEEARKKLYIADDVVIRILPRPADLPSPVDYRTALEASLETFAPRTPAQEGPPDGVVTKAEAVAEMQAAAEAQAEPDQSPDPATGPAPDAGNEASPEPDPS